MSLRTRASVVAVVLATALASSVPTRAIQQPQGPSTGREGTAGIDTPRKETGPSVSKPFQQLFDVQAATPSDPFHLQDRMRDRRFSQQSACGARATSHGLRPDGLEHRPGTRFPHAAPAAAAAERDLHDPEDHAAGVPEEAVGLVSRYACLAIHRSARWSGSL